MEFNKNYTILKEFSLYGYNCIYYTMEELTDLGLICCDYDTFKKNFGSRNFKVNYYDFSGKILSMSSRTLALEILESEKEGKNCRFFCKFNKYENEMIAIAFWEEYVLSFMDKLYCYSSIQVRDQKRDIILNEIDKLHHKISKSIDSNPEFREEYQKQLSTRKNHEQFKKIIPSD